MKFDKLRDPHRKLVAVLNSDNSAIFMQGHQSVYIIRNGGVELSTYTMLEEALLPPNRTPVYEGDVYEIIF